MLVLACVAVFVVVFVCVCVFMLMFVLVGVGLFLNAPHESCSCPRGMHPDGWLWWFPLMWSGVILQGCGIP